MCAGISSSQEQTLGRHSSGNIIGKPDCYNTTVMELKSDLWHTQTPSASSLRDQPTLFLRDRSTSVSQLVSRYQMTTENHSQENAEIKAEAIAKQMSSLVTTKPHVEALDRGNDNKDQSHSKTGLTRSKSMGSLQIKVVSFQSLKARFESKEDTQKKVTSKQSTSRSVEATQEKTAEAKQTNDPPLETEKHPPKSLKMKGDKWESPQIKTSLVRSKSTGSLRSSSGSIEALRARFESKMDAQNMARGVKNSPASIKPAEVLQVTDREAEGKSLKEKPRSQTADVPQKEGKDAPSSQKVVTRPRGEMRKTIAGIDFEKMVAIKADENRQSFTGFRDSSFEPTKDKLSVSVKAISALLLSKGAPKEPANGLLQTAQDQSPRSGRTFTNIKMADNSRQTAEDPHPPVSGRQQPCNRSDSRFLPVTAQVVKGNLHQQRQKCELRRLLKHTHPELKRLNDVLDEELAEVLSSDTGGAAEESGYEGEVLSRRLLFENRSTTEACFAPRLPVGRSENSKIAKCETQEESVKHNEEDDGIIDARATRKIFEGQSVSELPLFEDQRGNAQKSKQESKTGNLQNRNKEALHSSGPLHPQSPDYEFSGTDGSPFEDETSLRNMDAEEKLKTSAALFNNNPFIAANIEKESTTHNATGDSGEHRDCLTANVKKRAYLFESLPFDKIKHQNKDEVEAMVENIRDTLECLHHANVIHSDGSIIEVSETMIAKKAKFTLTDGGPMIKYDEVAEGGTQNFILQLVPRTHLKPRITYLKEDKKGSIEATIVNVGFHQETECKTAQLVQVVEDILHQDNSLRKGVIIQQNVEAWAEVIVYSLYKYFDEDDVKRYCPPQAREYEELQPESGAQEPGKGEAGSLMSSSKHTPKDQTLTASIGPEIIAKGNVKLFKTCIETGDLEYLKAFHAEPAMEEFPSINNVAIQGLELHPAQMDNQADTSEWVPVDVKKLKHMFSGDKSPNQPKEDEEQTRGQDSSGMFTGQTMNPTSIGSSGMISQQKVKENHTATPSKTSTHLQNQEDHVIHKAELVEVLADCDEISNLQLAINALQQATNEAKTLQEKSNVQEHTRPTSDVEQLNLANKNTEDYHRVTNNETHKPSCARMGPEGHSGCASSSETVAAEQEGEEVFEGKLQAALESLERSNINVTRGDFKAAMIYRNSSKSPQNAVHCFTQAPTKQIYPLSKPKSDQGQHSEEHKDTSRPGSAEKGRSAGPKPAIPPKPEHLKVKQDIHSTNKSLANEEPGSATLQPNQLNDGERHQDKGSIVSTEEENENGRQNLMVGEKVSSAEESMTKAMAVHFHEESQKTEKKSVMNAPKKPKRVKIAQLDHKSPNMEAQILTGKLASYPNISTDAEGKDPIDKSVTHESKVEMREKKGRSETEAERRQRLSVHMDEIVKGNITAAMEIFDNLRKQEELQSLLSRVEEIEKATSGVDVRSLRGVFENVPHWVVSSNRKKPNKVNEEKQQERTPSTTHSVGTKLSMEHVFGNLERASEEILNLKEQTLARLVDIEAAIKKALYSVSTLKSESDIAGLSSLLKESMGTDQGSPSAANISKISIGSYRAKPVLKWETPAEESGPLQGIQPASTGVKHQPSPSPSPNFISIQSAARQTPESKICPTCLQSPKTEEKFLTTATLTCNGERRGQEESCYNHKREVSVLEVQTDHKGNTITVTERTDPFGNRVYSSRASIIPVPPEPSMG
ncbi:xin actin-binding repeat-containing protein 1-like [Takifugu flavidus]|uniref:xin actin-binding repeat-containing protein 1-like n=1 Tax=Takifugu flavidus TaxID=433684 RepID=UPI0025449AC2|nr:xin actin-binding repeat-containing protein 1-like [Takifugu flavidus]